MTEQEKLDEYIKLMKETNQINSYQEQQIRACLAHKIKPLTIMYPRYYMRKSLLEVLEDLVL